MADCNEPDPVAKDISHGETKTLSISAQSSTCSLATYPGNTRKTGILPLSPSTGMVLRALTDFPWMTKEQRRRSAPCRRTPRTLVKVRDDFRSESVLVTQQQFDELGYGLLRLSRLLNNESEVLLNRLFRHGLSGARLGRANPHLPCVKLRISLVLVNAAQHDGQQG